MAKRLNPLNAEARIKSLLQAIKSDKNDNKTLAELSRRADELIRLSPLDARGYSLLGEIRIKQKRPDQANQLFAEALAKAPTEIVALLRSLDLAVRKGNVDKAIYYTDILLRRWPREFTRIQPLLTALAHDPAGALLLSRSLSTKPPWRAMVFNYLLKDQTGRAMLQKLVIEEFANGKQVNPRTLASIIYAYIVAGDTTTAYRTFILTLKPKQRKALGFIFDGQFTLDPNGGPFMWRVRNTAEADIVIPYHGNEAQSGGLALRFRDNPAKLGNISQLVSLPPGKYLLNIQASARNLVIPEGLFWVLACRKGGARLARVDIPEGTYKFQILSGNFKIPASGCAVQRLLLRTGVTTPTWQARYQNEVVFHNIIATRS